MIDAGVVAYVRWRDALPSVAHLGAEDAWQAFRAAHDGRCATCRREATRVVIDHCHVTGWVRGLICRSCNNTAGSGWPNLPLLNDMCSPVITAYVQLPPAVVAGLVRPYVSSWGTDPTDALERSIWHAGPDVIESGVEVIGRRLAAVMRNRTWAA